MRTLVVTLLFLVACTQHQKTEKPVQHVMKLSQPFIAYTARPGMGWYFPCFIEVGPVNNIGVVVIKFHSPILDSVKPKGEDSLVSFWKGEVDMTVIDSKNYSTSRAVFVFKKMSYESFQMTPGSNIISVTIKTHKR